MTAEKTVWHLISNRWNSAITEYALSSAVAVDRQDGWCSVFTPLLNSPASQRAQQLKLNTQPVQDFKLSSLGDLRKLAKEIKPDILCFYGGPEAFLGRFLGSSKKIRFMRHARGPFGMLDYIRYRYLDSHIDHWLCPAARMRNGLSAVVSRPVSSIILGIDDQRYSYQKISDVSNSRPEVLIFGRLDPVKGHEYAIKLMKAVINNWTYDSPPPFLHIAGCEENLTASDIELYTKQQQLAFGSDVKVTTGRINDVAMMMSEATLGFVPSLDSEVICRVGQEFLMCGTPVIVSGVGSLNEILFKPEMGASFSGLGSDDDRFALLGQWIAKAAQEPSEDRAHRASQAQKEFSLELMGSRLIQVFECF